MPTLWLVRHGQASWGKADYDQLSELGVRQARQLGLFLRGRGLRVTRAITGTMRRHRQTADATLRAAGFEGTLREDGGWNEFDHQAVLVSHRPAWRSRTRMMADLARTGRPRAAFHDVFEAALEAWIAGEGTTEPYPAFRARVDDALARTAAEAEGLTLVFTSGGPIGAVIAAGLGADWRRANRSMVNTGVTRVVVGARGVTVVSMNEQGHLDGLDGLRTLR